MFEGRKQHITEERISEYKAYLIGEERAPATVEKYMRDIRAFAVWLDGRAADKENIATWKAELLVQGLTPGTVNSKLSALNGFFNFLGWQDCRVRFLRIQRRVFRSREKELTREEYDRLLATAAEQGKHRLTLLMETICATGIRVSEVRYITVEAAQRGMTEIVLKGKIRTILLPGKLCRKLLKYAKRQRIGRGEIFRTASGRSMSRRQIWGEMKNLCRAAQVEPSKVFPHNLRHLFARTFYRACQDIVTLADVLGHSSIETTRIYLISTGAEHARRLEQLGLVS